MLDKLLNFVDETTLEAARDEDGNSIEDYVVAHLKSKEHCRSRKKLTKEFWTENVLRRFGLLNSVASLLPPPTGTPEELAENLELKACLDKAVWRNPAKRTIAKLEDFLAEAEDLRFVDIWRIVEKTTESPQMPRIDGMKILVYLLEFCVRISIVLLCFSRFGCDNCY